MVIPRLNNKSFLNDTKDPTATKDIEDKTEVGLSKILKKFIEDISKIFKSSMGETKSTEKLIGLDSVPVIDTSDIDNELNKLKGKVDKNLMGIMGSSIKAAYRRGINKAQQQLNRIQTHPTNSRLSKKDEQTVLLLQNTDFSLIKTLTQQQIQQAKDLFILGLANGLSQKQIISNIMSITSGGYKQIKRIVRTELTRTSNIGAKKRYLQSGQRYVQWNTAIDERVCPICGQLHGKVQEIGKTFTVFLTGKAQRMNKGKDIKMPPAHPNCRCGITPAFKKRKIIKKPSKTPKVKKPKISMSGFSLKERIEFNNLIKIIPQQIRNLVKEFNGTKTIIKTKGDVVDDERVQKEITPDVQNRFRDAEGIFIENGDNRVFVKSGTGKKELLHETGHAVYKDYLNLKTRTKNEWIKLWEKQKEEGKLPTARSGLDETEFFADCFRFYYLQRDWFEKQYPEIFKFMKDNVFFGNTKEQKVSMEI